ncbi:helix-turn-helix domain-containing protein [Streptomyces sp. NPDC058067]|uniref:helix-turn-helix domain-containing protein n=1 Tax=Streptomyces sp. NPDC058067 TaxID=3346324 RepID=UPI0036E88CDE
MTYPLASASLAPSGPLITGDLAAAETGVTPATIRKWVQRGHLASAGQQGRALLYRLEDVFAAERAVNLRTATASSRSAG